MESRNLGQDFWVVISGKQIFIFDIFRGFRCCRLVGRRKVLQKKHKNGLRHIKLKWRHSEKFFETIELYLNVTWYIFYFFRPFPFVGYDESKFWMFYTDLIWNLKNSLQKIPHVSKGPINIDQKSHSASLLAHICKLDKI